MNGPQKQDNHAQDEPMDEFEQALQRALRHVEVRRELTERLLSIAGEIECERQERGGGVRWIAPRSGGRVLAFPRLPSWTHGAIAAALLLICLFFGLNVHKRQKQEQRVAEQRAAANQQFDASVRIMDRTLEHTREQLRQAGVSDLD